MELIIFNNSSLTITVLSNDGKIYDFFIVLKSKGLCNSSNFVLPLPRKVEKYDLFKRGSLGFNKYFLGYLQKLMIYYSKYYYAKGCGDIGLSLVLVPKHMEFVEQEKISIGKVNFQEEIHDKEKNDNEVGSILENSGIMKMMTKMGYNKGKGLGRKSEGPPAFVLDCEIRTQKNTYGIGYRSTALDDINQRKIRIAKARARKEYVSFDVPMRPYPLTLNGQFIRAGDTRPYWGFRDPVIVATGWDI